MKWAEISKEERNMLVASKVIGWQSKECQGEIGEQPISPDGWFCLRCGHDGSWGDNMTHEEKPPRYSQSMTTAWDILIHIQKEYSFSQRRVFFAEIQQLVTKATNLNGTGKLIAWPDVLFWLNPEIICLAALCAVGLEID